MGITLLSALILTISFVVMGDPHFIPAPLSPREQKKESSTKKVSPQKQEEPVIQNKPVNKKIRRRYE